MAIKAVVQTFRTHFGGYSARSLLRSVKVKAVRELALRVSYWGVVITSLKLGARQNRSYAVCNNCKESWLCSVAVHNDSGKSRPNGNPCAHRQLCEGCQKVCAFSSFQARMEQTDILYLRRYAENRRYSHVSRNCNSTDHAFASVSETWNDWTELQRIKYSYIYSHSSRVTAIKHKKRCRIQPLTT